MNLPKAQKSLTPALILDGNPTAVGLGRDVQRRSPRRRPHNLSGLRHQEGVLQVRELQPFPRVPILPSFLPPCSLSDNDSVVLSSAPVIFRTRNVGAIATSAHSPQPLWFHRVRFNGHILRRLPSTEDPLSSAVLNKKNTDCKFSAKTNDVVKGNEVAIQDVSLTFIPKTGTRDVNQGRQRGGGTCARST